MLHSLIAASTSRDRGLFISTWNPSLTSTGSSLATQVRLPLISGGQYNFVVDWGDGTSNTITSFSSPDATHTYATTGNKQIQIKGTFNGFAFNNTGDRLKLLSIERWGCFRLTGTSVFYGCTNLNLSTVADGLNLFGATGFSSLFRECTSLTSIANLDKWDTSNIVSMANVFLNCTSFNQDISTFSFLNCTSANNMMLGKSSANYSAVFYDKLLISMANQNMNFNSWVAGFGTVKRTASNVEAANARDFLTRSIASGGRALTITDGGTL